MNLSIKKTTLIFAALAITLLVSIPAEAQKRKMNNRVRRVAMNNRAQSPEMWLTSGVPRVDTVSREWMRYSIRVRQGQTLSVSVRPTNREVIDRLRISTMRSASGSDDVDGNFDDNGKVWRGTVSSTGTYYIFVSAERGTVIRVRAKLD